MSWAHCFNYFLWNRLRLYYLWTLLKSCSILLHRNLIRTLNLMSSVLDYSSYIEGLRTGEIRTDFATISAWKTLNVKFKANAEFLVLHNRKWNHIILYGAVYFNKLWWTYLRRTPEVYGARRLLTPLDVNATILMVALSFINLKVINHLQS